MPFTETMGNPWHPGKDLSDSISIKLAEMYHKEMPNGKFYFPDFVATDAIRLIRDALAYAWATGEIKDLYDAELFLNRALNRAHVSTITGDTTEYSVETA